MNTFKALINLQNRTIIDSRWAQRVKEAPDGKVDKLKSRVVAQGYDQKQVFDFYRTFSLVVKPMTIRMVLTLGLTR